MVILLYLNANARGIIKLLMIYSYIRLFESILSNYLVLGTPFLEMLSIKLRSGVSLPLVEVVIISRGSFQSLYSWRFGCVRTVQA